MLEVMEVTGATPNLSQAMRLKEISQKEGLTPESISEILSELKANQRERLHIQTEKIRKFFPKSYTLQQMEEEIIKLCEKNYRNKQKDAR